MDAFSRSRQALSSEYQIAKLVVDTAENEAFKDLPDHSADYMPSVL
jgi:hypothetical protein